MFCSNCGKELPENANFCAQCGTKQAISQPAPQPVPTPAPQPTPQPVEPAPVVQPQAPTQPPVVQVQTPFQNTAQPQYAPQPQTKPKSNGKKIAGIVLTVLGAMAILGGASNGFFEEISANGAQDPSDIITILLVVGMVVGGIILIIKSKNNKS